MIRHMFACGFYGFMTSLFIGFLGFLAFVYSLDRFEQKPETRADGIVAMTGGAQRIGDAIDLLAQGYAKRLLISGVNEKTSLEEISRLNPGQRRLFDCCVDLDYRARNTIGNAIETRRWAERNHFAALIVVTSNYHMPRTLVELNHALPNMQKIPYPVAATIDPHEWWHNPSTAQGPVFRIREIHRRLAADPARGRSRGFRRWPASWAAPSSMRRRIRPGASDAVRPENRCPDGLRLFKDGRGAGHEVPLFSSRTMLILRSLLFNVAFYANLVFWMIVLLPALALPRRVFIRGAKYWARTSMWLMRVIVGTRVELRGLDRIPPGGLLVAAKHQSVWETFALLTLFADPAFILKRELMWIPFFGWYTWKGGSVPVNRKGGAQALLRMMSRAKGEIQKGRQILIFPEGTRRPAGAAPAYKFGIGHLYQHLGAPCLPVALEFRPVLAPAQIPAATRHHRGGNPRRHPARNAPKRLLQGDAGADRDRLRPARRGRAARARAPGRGVEYRRRLSIPTAATRVSRP